MNNITEDKVLLKELKSYQAQLEKEEKRIWKKSSQSYELQSLLGLLTKSELDIIRKNLEIKGVSGLKKADLAVALAEAMPVHFNQILSLLDLERYTFLKSIKKSGILVEIDEVPLYQIEALMGYGMIFPIIEDDRKLLVMPTEVVELFDTVNEVELQRVLKRNTEWIKLTHGMLYFYGVMETFKVREKVESLSSEHVNVHEFNKVISDASDYYQEVSYSATLMADERIIDPKEVLMDHRQRPNVDYYPFTKKQLLQAGTPGYINKSKEMDKLLKFLKEGYDLSTQELDEIADDIILIINEEASPNPIIEYLQTLFEFPSFEFLKQLTELVMDASNNTRQWMIKGHTPLELSKHERKQLLPLNTTSFIPPKQASSTEIEQPATKVGRNDPCICGSGKKYKKCCGK